MKPFSFCSVVALAIFLATASFGWAEVVTPLAAADAALKSWKLTEAIAGYETVLSTEPDNLAALTGYAKAKARLANLTFSRALADYDKAIATHPDSAELFGGRGELNILWGRFDAALADFQQVRALDPHYFTINAYFAEIYLYLKQPEKALAEALAGRAAEPDYAIQLVNEAHGYLFTGQVEKARELYLQAAPHSEIPGGVTCRVIVLNDFKKMRACGVTHPAMAEIEVLLKDGH